MKIIAAIPRILLGLVFGVMPWLAILHLAPNPPMPQGATDFVTALMKTGYMMPLVWGTEVVAGILILLGIFVPFALVVLAPVLVNIFAFHVFLNPTGMTIAIVACLLALIVAWQYRRSFSALFVSGLPA
ncbi:MAG TPA: DoxX family membrane protein [Candidatus Binataceae bacterium]|nr:DoxX family membrane protein [Candidatus Binataceae bacterium]